MSEHDRCDVCGRVFSPQIVLDDDGKLPPGVTVDYPLCYAVEFHNDKDVYLCPECFIDPARPLRSMPTAPGIGAEGG